MSASEVIATVAGKAKEKFGLDLQFELREADIWIQVDTYTIVSSALLFVQERLMEETGCKKFGCQPSKEGRFVYIDFIWQGNPVKMETLRKWQNQIVAVDDEISLRHSRRLSDITKLKSGPIHWERTVDRTYGYFSRQWSPWKLNIYTS